jgi:hypothetical protein
MRRDLLYVDRFGAFERKGGLGLGSTFQKNLHIGYFSISAYGKALSPVAAFYGVPLARNRVRSGADTKS